MNLVSIKETEIATESSSHRRQHLLELEGAKDGYLSWKSVDMEMPRCENVGVRRTGLLVVEKVDGKSTPTRCFSQYPLKLIIPSKAGLNSDAVWVYTISYGGGIVSGDHISCSVRLRDGCTTVIKTQASTKVYKAIGEKCCEQFLEAEVSSDGLLAVLPDPVTCFCGARYIQKQMFRIASHSNLILVDWLTSGRRESGERWEFDFYKSTNNIFLEGNQPLFLDSVVLERSTEFSVAHYMHNYQVTAMLIIVGPKLKYIQDQVKDDVKQMMSQLFHLPFSSRSFHGSKKLRLQDVTSKPDFIVSCSGFGPKDIGLVVRIMAMSTEAVYKFLNQCLQGAVPLLGAIPYC